MNVQLNMTDTEKRFVFLLGIIGIIGVFLILLSDIIYNLLGGNEFGYLLYLPTYLGVFCFPFWRGDLWVIYQGLKPAGFMWSFMLCLLFGYLVSTVNTEGHVRLDVCVEWVYQGNDLFPGKIFGGNTFVRYFRAYERKNQIGKESRQVCALYI